MTDERIFRLDNKVAIVTGGGGGIGRAICELFANVGAHVACVDLDEQAADSAARAIRESGGRAVGLRCDVASETETQAVAAEVERTLGLPTVLVNGAAMLDRSGTILDIGPQEWDQVMRVNLGGAYMMSRAALPGMIRAGGGAIVHIASMHARVGRAGRVSYTSAKGAMLQLAKTMAVDHAAQGIRVNTLSPGAVETRRIAFRYGEMPAEQKRQAESKYLLNRFAAPAEIAAAALFLASPASSYMTGADLLVDGGYCAV
ncbi:SDR family NAD(P)-dependent oxidoreductase [Bordetella sp. BOR01]|uniref:SDR family NAD(P)-dependent oxidoreductase n=1 Tax=Bordetella sp. BOR01 TaxID=2854779 RepID=UPI001C48D972|nr:glucose 1-dehydrogenase [Bordetella sp. BOR01]MBV7484649.1 glucose 1-dehydrogenase [Bordetella sp. BOR01]